MGGAASCPGWALAVRPARLLAAASRAVTVATMTTARGRATRFLIPLALAASALALAPTAASAAPPLDPVDPFRVSGLEGTGYDGVYQGRAAGDRIVFGDQGGGLNVYCIEFDKPALTTNTHLTGVDWQDAGLDPADAQQVAAIAANSASLGTPLADRKAEAAAIQVAIWAVTDDIDYETIPNASIVARATELLTATTAATFTDPYRPELGNIRLAEMKATRPTATTNAIQVKVVDGDGAPLAGMDMVVYAGKPNPTTGYIEVEEARATTDANGVATLTGGTEDWAGRSIDINLETTVNAGTVLRPSVDQQMVVVANSTNLEIGFGRFDFPVVPVDVTPTPTPTPTPTATPTAPPATPTPAKPGQLPYTGSVGTPALFAGLVVLAGAAGAIVVKTRRKSA